ncbi:hypothetical protein DFH08DRAFT_835644 [Mycena albidolilacea]|uniref:DUF7598 domain-containing protein n=1 Tax=Mycena albidolilacea TaxID=1033008 RepID=A0AAD7ARW3_9AGAR|nr:hypothetical protein DFH08DRAFT_835644 [Mycena albidolilacea]
MLPPRAYTFIGLNGLRVLSIIGLILVFSSQIVTLVHDIQAVNNFQAGKAAAVSDSATNTTTEDILSNDYVIGSTVPNQPAGVFWAVLNRLLIIFQVIILLLSEFGWPSAFFNRFFPVLGKDFGLGALGIIECLLGAAILSHHVDEFSLVAAFFLFAIGCLNMLAGLIFRESAKSKRSITSWRDHAKNALPTHVAGVDVRPVATAAPSFVSSVFKEKPQEEPKIGNGFGRQGERAAGLKGFLISKPIESLPRYASSRSPSAA